MPVIIPPIKSQGIKTKLLPWINDLILTSGISLNARWIEPFSARVLSASIRLLMVLIS